MNFLAHAEVARRVPGADDEVTLGAMLPDLRHLVGLHVTPDLLPPMIRAGWACHIATDKVFHADARFRSAVVHMSRCLVQAGWNRWPAQAAAHVSWELLLDGQVARWSDPARWFEPALRCVSFLEHLDPQQRERWGDVAERQAERPLWESYLDAPQVADRTWRRLGSTRVAFPVAGIPALGELLSEQVESVAALSRELVSSAVEAIADRH